MITYKQFVKEGNPLSRLVTKPRHGVIISAARKELSAKENKERMKSLYKDIKDSGATFKKTKGVWKNAADEVDN